MAQATWHALKCEAVRWRRLKKPARAIECLVGAIELTRQSPELARETGSMLNYLADLYLQEGQLTQAEAAIRQALQTNLSLPSSDRSLATDDLMILARILSRQARHREAYEAAKQSLNSFRRLKGMPDNFIAQIEGMVEELRRKKEQEAGIESAPDRTSQGDSDGTVKEKASS